MVGSLRGREPGRRGTSAVGSNVTENNGLCVIVSRETGTSQQGPEMWNTEADDIVGIRCQATPNEDIEDIVCATVRGNVCELAIAP
jgi:hypothetical protein